MLLLMNPVLVMWMMLVFLLAENTFVYANETKPVLAVSELLVLLEGENNIVYAGETTIHVVSAMLVFLEGRGVWVFLLAVVLVLVLSRAFLPQARKCRDASFSSLFVRCMSPSQRVAHVSDSVTRLLTTPTRDMHMNSCGSMHGSVMHDNSSGMHVNSCGALGHKNSCHVHAA